MLIGVTGNFVSGKSAFLIILRSFGFETIESDKIVRKIYKEKAVIEKVKESFGPTIVLGGYIDRDLLRIIIFNDSKKREKLNSIVHPLITEKIKQLDHSGKIVFVEVPLLFEANMQKLFDKIILVKSSLETACERAVRKGFTETEFKQIIKTQGSAESKEKKSDWVVDTEGNISGLRKKVSKIVEELKKGSD